MYDIQEACRRAKAASKAAAKLGTQKKNEALMAVEQGLNENADAILKANEEDLENARKNNMDSAMVDRLTLTRKRIRQIALGLHQVAELPDPIGDVRNMRRRPNGLRIGEMRVPLGVIGIIYESRPNVTADSFALTFKTGNAVILRGGSDCINSNMAITKVCRDTLKNCGIPEDVIQLVTDTDRKYVNELITMDRYLDVIIPRGGAGLIENVVKHATVPVIRTGTGNCHIYVDRTADIDMALRIIKNAKLQRLGVCNAAESLVVHQDIADKAIPAIAGMLQKEGCEMRGDEKSRALSAAIVPASDADYGTEYLAKIISVKIVKNLDEAISHINHYSTGHSEAIITRDYASAQKFLDEVDSAAVYVNASTRFTDGFEFGFGAEIGISTQKLHARGPMGLEALTTTKYIIYGNGQIRP